MVKKKKGLLNKSKPVLVKSSKKSAKLSKLNALKTDSKKIISKKKSSTKTIFALQKNKKSKKSYTNQKKIKSKSIKLISDSTKKSKPSKKTLAKIEELGLFKIKETLPKIDEKVSKEKNALNPSFSKPLKVPSPKKLLGASFSSKSVKQKNQKASKQNKEPSSKLEMINEKLDKLLEENKELLSTQHKIEKEEEKIEFNEENLFLAEEKLEKRELELERLEKEELSTEKHVEHFEIEEEKKIDHLENIEKKELDELKKLEEIENKIKKDVEPHPLAKITIKDFFKGSIGAFIGLVLHYTFLYGLEIAEKLTIARATFLFFLAYAVGGVVMYAAGFRKVTEPKLLIFWPLRLTILFLTSLLVSIVVLYIFVPEYGLHLGESYMQTSAVMLSAIIGATTADLIGKE